MDDLSIQGIFDTVVALNMLGIPTRMSCEGHLDHGLPYSWVSIAPLEHPVPRKRKIGYLLNEFYRDRDVPHDRRIIIDVMLRRIHSRGGGNPQKLSEYQQEMRDFTTFLRERL